MRLTVLDPVQFGSTEVTRQGHTGECVKCNSSEVRTEAANELKDYTSNSKQTVNGAISRWVNDFT